MENILLKAISIINTFIYFGLVCLIIPFLIASGLTNKINLLIMGAIYPNYEFSRSKKMRTLIDTKKNAAIFHFLLEINGPLNFEKIKENYLVNLVEKRIKNGKLKFPKLRKRLTTWWWQYAWDEDCSKFDIDKHVYLNTTRTFRGRNLCESNFKEFVSELVTKYIPSDISPWQVIVLRPIVKNEKNLQTFHILIKVHHLLVAEENDLHISDLLMLNSSNSIKMFKNQIDDSKFKISVQRPIHIPNLWNQIYMTAINRWNEFIYHYDPLESPDVDKKKQITCLSQLISICFITFVTILTDFVKGFSKTNNHIKYKIRYLLHLFKRETLKRNLTIETIVDSLVTSFNPINIFKNIVRFIWYTITVSIILTPYYIIRELLALKDIVMNGHTEYSDTLFGIISIYLPLTYYATKEFLQIFTYILNAPRNCYDELSISRSTEKNFLHSKSFSGRKVIAYSKPISLDLVDRRISDSGKEIDFVLASLLGALRNYLNIYSSTNGPPPNFINATCRSINKKFLIERHNKTDNIGGVLFFKLPLVDLNIQTDFLEISNLITRVLEKQEILYLISVGQIKFDILTKVIPEVLMKLLINYFSYYYPVTITEIYGDSEKMETLWGQEVKDLLFFRPPQSKTCLSLNIHRFGNTVRLAVMADTHLSPEHAKIIDFFELNMENSFSVFNS